MSNHSIGTSGEFYVLSMLLRLGLEAYFTLGNAKAVDIVFFRDGLKFTVDAKTTGASVDFIFGNTTLSKKSSYLEKLEQQKHHFYAFVAYNGRMADPLAIPDCYIVPASIVSTVLTITSGKRAKEGTKDPSVGVNASIKKLRTSKTLNAWNQLTQHVP